MINLLFFLGACILALYLFKMSKRHKKQRGGINKKALVAILVLVGISAVVGYFVWKNYHKSSPTPSPTPSPSPSPSPCTREIQSQCSGLSSLNEHCCSLWANNNGFHYEANDYDTIPPGCFRDMNTSNVADITRSKVWFNTKPQPTCMTSSPSPTHRCTNDNKKTTIGNNTYMTDTLKVTPANICSASSIA